MAWCAVIDTGLTARQAACGIVSVPIMLGDTSRRATMMMLSKLSMFWVFMSVSTVGVISYFVALTIDGVFGKDGFGTLGNMAVLTAGFFLGLIVAEEIGYIVRGFQMATFVGIAGALSTFMTLAFLKLGMEKLR
jgi:hypothetical protein